MTNKSNANDRKPYIERLTKAAINWFTHVEQANLDFVGYESEDGPRLFADFTSRHADYYPYRKEVDLISGSIAAIDEEIDINSIENLVIVGQGPWGNCLEKEGHIISRALGDPDSQLKKVKFIDLSAEFNKQAVAGLERMIDEHNANADEDNQVALEVETYDADFERLAKNYQPEPNTAVFSTGSTITNLDNRVNTSFPQSRVKQILTAFKRIAGPDGSIVLGYDGNMDEGSNLRAYSSVDLSHFFYNMMWEIHSKAEGLSLHYMDEGGHYQEMTKEKLMAGEIVRYRPVWNGQQIQHTLEFVVPVELQVDLHNEELWRIADEIDGRDRLNGGLHFGKGETLITMISGKFNDQNVSQAAKRANLKPGKVLKESETGLCLHMFRAPPAEKTKNNDAQQEKKDTEGHSNDNSASAAANDAAEPADKEAATNQQNDDFSTEASLTETASNSFPNEADQTSRTVVATQPFRTPLVGSKAALRHSL